MSERGGVYDLQFLFSRDFEGNSYSVRCAERYGNICSLVKDYYREDSFIDFEIRRAFRCKPQGTSGFHNSCNERMSLFSRFLIANSVFQNNFLQAELIQQ